MDVTRSAALSSDAPAARRYPAYPRIGVGAVVFDPLHRVLLIRRGNPPAAGQWGLPGGLLLLGESLQDALHRELWEECRIRVDIVDLVSLYETVVRDAEDRIAYHYVVADYLCHWRAGDITPGDDAQAVAWASADNIAQYALLQAATEMIAAARAKDLRPRAG